MQNLIPLNLDRTTGQLVAKDVLGNQLPPGFRHVRGYIYLQQTPSIAWDIQHDGNSDDVLVQIYTPDGELILPDRVLVVSDSLVRVVFAAPMDGKALLSLFAFNLDDETYPHVSI